jgi:hypothetical protein
MSTEGSASVLTAVGGAHLLWRGGGAAGAVSRPRRIRHRVRTLVSEHPSAYLPFARLKYPGPSPRVIGPDTAVVIDGYTRSASTFAVYAFQLSQSRPVRVAHHLHAPAQLIEAARRGLPTLMVIREPRGALLSQLVREPDVDLLEALYSYRRFHTSLMGYRDAFVVADFVQVTGDFGAVVGQMNEKYGTTFGRFSGTPSEVSRCMHLIERRPTLSPYLLGFESGEVTLVEAEAQLASLPGPASADAAWIPSSARNDAKRVLERLWSSPRLASARSRAEDCYEAFLAS